MTSRDIILTLALASNNDWNVIYQRLKDKEYPTDEEVNLFLNPFNGNAITILDSEYPNRLKQKTKPPFVLYYDGDLSLLKRVDGNNGKNDLVFLHGPNTLHIPSDKLCVITVDNKIDICGGLRVWFNKESTNVDRYGLAAGLFQNIVGTKIYPDDSHSWFIGVTIRDALDIGGDVYMVASTPPSYNNRLIKQGCHLIDCYADILSHSLPSDMPF